MDNCPVLSEKLTTVMAEANRLLDLKAGFGRLPRSVLRTEAMEEIDAWFNRGLEQAILTCRGFLPETSMYLPIPEPILEPSVGEISPRARNSGFFGEDFHAGREDPNDSVPF